MSYRIMVFYEDGGYGPRKMTEPFGDEYNYSEKDSSYAFYDSVSGCDIPKDTIPQWCKEVIVALYDCEREAQSTPLECKTVLEF